MGSLLDACLSGRKPAFSLGIAGTVVMAKTGTSLLVTIDGMEGRYG